MTRPYATRLILALFVAGLVLSEGIEASGQMGPGMMEWGTEQMEEASQMMS
jgi:hypothetical protein